MTRLSFGPEDKPRLVLDSSEKTSIAIDFDDVIYKNSKGWHDGTIYDKPIDGALKALKELASRYRVVVYTSKVRDDRPLVNNKTGVVLVNEWLKKYEFDQYVDEVTHIKPRAVAYIDDKAIRFVDWVSTLQQLKDLGL